jgi:hypothetical protein
MTDDQCALSVDQKVSVLRRSTPTPSPMRSFSNAALQSVSDLTQVDTTVLGCTPEEAEEKPYIASMGIYVFKKQALLKLLAANPDDNDFGGDVIPRASMMGEQTPHLHCTHRRFGCNHAFEQPAIFLGALFRAIVCESKLTWYFS